MSSSSFVDLPVEIIRSTRRKKSIGIRFVPPGSLELQVPHRLSQQQLHTILRTNYLSLQKRLRLFSDQWQAREQQRESVDTFLYLGKWYPLTFPRDRLDDWYKTRATRIFTEYVTELAQEMGVVVHKIRVRTMRSRWGSYSTKKTVSLNQRLIMAPPRIIRYVVIHELAHAAHHNHGKHFWKLVERYDTNYIEHRRWLRRHGWQLTL